MNRATFILAVFLHVGTDVFAQFVNVTDDQNIHSLNTGNLYGNGVSFFDFNHDGWDDLSMASGAGEPQFFVNNQGQFEPINFGLLNSDGKQVHAVQWVDWDNDGDSDLFLTRLNAWPRLMRNDGNLTFTDITSTSGINPGIYIYLGAAWTDYDKDGNLDFYLSKYYNPNNYPGNEFISRLYRGNGDGTFVDVTMSSGVFLPPRPCFQPVWFDYDDDGWEDLYLIIDRNSWSNEMFHNNGDGTFTNTTIATGTGVFIDAMTGTIGDYDNDLDFDIYVTNGYDGNKLFRNEGNGTFVEIAEDLGIDVGAICWGAQWIDYNNNTWQDLYVSATGSFYGPYQNQFFINDQQGGFYSGIQAVGLNGDISPSMATTMGDMNNDGYYDYFSANNAPYEADLWQNLGGANHWLGVELEGTISNRDAFGTKLKLHCNGATYLRCAHGGENFQGQNSGKEIFGLGEQTLVDSLEIFWPLGLREVYYNILPDQYLNLVEGESLNEPAAIQVGTSTYCDVQDVLLSSQAWEILSWSDGTLGDSLWVNDPGIFTAVVRDANGHLFQTLPVELSEYTTPQYTIAIQELMCYGDQDGQLSFQLTNDADVNYVTWNDGAYFGNQIAQLDSGSYEIQIHYGQNCVIAESIALTMPEELTATGIAQNVSCFGLQDGSIVMSVAGGTAGYVVHWGELNPNYLYAGMYDVEVTDSHDCTALVSFQIEQPDELQVLFSLGHVSCNGETDGTIVLNDIQGGIPGYTIDWNASDTTSLGVGFYAFTVLDATGCSLSQSFEIVQPDPLVVEIETSNVFENGPEGSATLSIGGGNPPYTILLNGDEGALSNVNLASGNYEVEITDANGCEIQTSFEIEFINSILEQTNDCFGLSPNPAHDRIALLHLTESLNVRIIDIAGSIVQSKRLSPGEYIDVSKLSAGTYWLISDAYPAAPQKFVKY